MLSENKFLTPNNAGQSLAYHERQLEKSEKNTSLKHEVKRQQ